MSVRIDYGELPLRRVVTPLIKRKATAVHATLGGQDRQVSIERADGSYAIVFERPALIARGQTLKITIG